MGRKWIFVPLCCTKLSPVSAADLIFLHAMFKPENVHYTDKVFDGYYSLQLMTGGGVEVWYGAERWLLEGAWFWPAFPGPHIKFHVAPGYRTWPHRYVSFRGPRASRWQAEGLFPSVPQPAPDGKDLVPLFDELIAHAIDTGRWAPLKAANLLERLLLELAEARSQANDESDAPWLPGLLEELSRNVSETPDYAAIARRLGMGMSTLHRRFKRATGTTLHAYTLQCRIAAARELLGETDLPIKSIAARLGYADTYFFSRQFRAMTGVPPGAYRKSRQA